MENWNRWYKMELEGKHMDELLREMEEQGLTLGPSSVSYTRKEALYRKLPEKDAALDPQQSELWSIARMEGDLNPSQEEEFDRLLSEDKDLAREWELIQACRLPVREISYSAKSKLKKRTAGVGRISGAGRIYWVTSVAAAAAIALLLTLFRGVPEPLGPEVFSETPDLPVENLASDEGGNQPASTPTTESILPSFRKHPEPPELTGKEKGESSQADSTDNSMAEKALAREPVRLALTPRAMVRPGADFRPDRIQNLDLPAFSSGRGRLDWKRISEKGIQVANAGMNQINRMTGSDLNLEVDRGEEGKLKGFTFRSRLFNVESISDSPD